MKYKNIFFVYIGGEGESLAIEYLSAVLKKAGHKTDLILDYPGENTNFRKRLFKRIEEFKPDFICFSLVTDDYAWGCKVARLIKSRYDIPIVFGGIHVSSMPELVIKSEFVDYAVIGEGEGAILDIVNNPKKKNIKNVWLKHEGKIIKNEIRPLIKNLDSLPFQDRMLLHKEAPYLDDIYHAITSRGCPFSCTYCFNNYMKKLYKGKGCWRRKRSVNNVIKELKIMKKLLSYKQILFVDDCFIDNLDWLEDFIKKYKKEIAVPFKAIVHPVFINEKVVKLLKVGGCIRVQIGVQSPIERVKKEICHRSESNETIEKAVELLKKNKIMVQVDHIFGLPSETIEDYIKGLNFYISIKPTYISPFFLQYFPKTEIIDIGRKYKTISEEELKKIELGEMVYNDRILQAMSSKKLASIVSVFCWLPILPRHLTKFLVKHALFLIPKNKFFNSIPYITQHFFSKELRQTLMISIRRKRGLKKRIGMLAKLNNL